MSSYDLKAVYVRLETPFRWIQSLFKQHFDTCSGSLIFLSTRVSLSLFLFKRSALVLQNHFERILESQIINQVFFVSDQLAASFESDSVRKALLLLFPYLSLSELLKVLKSESNQIRLA